jgi:hypothetical protein
MTDVLAYIMPIITCVGARVGSDLDDLMKKYDISL